MSKKKVKVDKKVDNTAALPGNLPDPSLNAPAVDTPIKRKPNKGNFLTRLFNRNKNKNSQKPQQASESIERKSDENKAIKFGYYEYDALRNVYRLKKQEGTKSKFPKKLDNIPSKEGLVSLAYARAIKKNEKRKRRFALSTSIIGIIFAGLLGFSASQEIIRLNMLKNQLPVQSPFGSVQDTFGDNPPTDENGHINPDTTSDTDKQIWKNTFYSLIKNDANKYGDFVTDESKISVVSTNLIPFDLYKPEGVETANWDSYILSFIVKNENDLFALNYFTAEDFSTTAKTTNEEMKDFVNYMQKDCALYSCSYMSDEAKTIVEAIPDICYVGEPVDYGKTDSGSDCVSVPVYYNNGGGTAYTIEHSTLENLNISPDELPNKINEWYNGGSTLNFEEVLFVNNSNTEKFTQEILGNTTTVTSSYIYAYEPNKNELQR